MDNGHLRFKKEDLFERVLNFGVNIIKLVGELPKTPAGFKIGSQIVGSATSIGANTQEAQDASSKQDFISKMSIALREAKESKFWLKLIKKSDLLKAEKINPLLIEADELCAIYSTIVRKSKFNLSNVKSQMSNVSAFTLIELLVVVAIIVLLSVIGIATFSGVRTKAQDTVRKNDLQSLATALELYYQKNGAYPAPVAPATSSNNCNPEGDTKILYDSIPSFLSGDQVPTDPETNTKYCYISIDGGKGYRLYASLKKCTQDQNSLCQFQTNNYSLVSEGNTVAAAPGSVTIPLEKPLSCELYGDLDRNNRITTSDADRINEIDATMDQIPDEIKYLADVSGDNEVTPLDSLMVNRYLAGTDSVMKRVCENARPSPCNGIGDITGDGKITPVDMFEASLIALGESNSFYTQAPYTNTQRQNADVNGNGMDITDALDIIRYYKKEINTFSACPI